MSVRNSNSLLETTLAPRTFFLAVAGSLLACSLLGRAASRQNPYEDFVRFFDRLNYLSLFYPTASQTRAIVRVGTKPQQVAVVVGGCSIMHGSGQGVEKLWTNQLQSLLGDKYRVFNFAIPGVGTLEVGSTTAEAVAREHKKVIFVTHVWPGANANAAPLDGGSHRYFFWDAYYKGMLTDNPERNAALTELAHTERDTRGYSELKIRAWLDSFLYCQDLWTTFACLCANTVWCPVLREEFTKPRVRYTDKELPYPLALHYAPAWEEVVMPGLPADVQLRYWQRPPGADYKDTATARFLRSGLPENLRKSTLVVITYRSPYYTKRLPAPLQELYRATFPQTVKAVEAAGCEALVVGPGLTEADFFDHWHLSSEGAGKMAAAVAAKVQEIAKRRGFDR